MTEERIVTVRGVVAATPETIFDLIADPARQPEWDGNGNLDHAEPGQRITGTGQTFVMHNVGGNVRENHVVEFEEGRRVAWKPAEEGGEPFGQLWRWELTPLDDDRTEVTHTYDWTELRDESREARARRTTPAALRASLDRLAGAAESASAR